MAAALRGLPFAPGDGSIEAISAFWRDTIWRARLDGKRLRHYIEVRYERLVAEPEAVLRELCEFLDLPFEAGMLRAREGAQDPGRVGRWREDLSEYELTRFERFAGAALDDLGYPPYERHASPTSARTESAGRTGTMRIVLGRESCGTLGGTETYAITVARELQRLGHHVTLATDELGVMTDVARGQGVQVATLNELPSGCDAVLAHDTPMAAALAARFPDARLVYVVHGDGFDDHLPPLIPTMVDAVIACSDRMAARARAVPLEVPLVRLREPIDTDRYLDPRPLPAHPRRALILSNYLRGERRRVLVEAWESAGIKCRQVGNPASPVLDPRPEMEAADIVVGKARAALEAMSCGRAVYVYDQFGADGWVTAGSYPAFEADHFAGQATPAPRGREDLIGDLAAYSPDMGVANAELVRTHHGARHHAIELVAVLRGPHERDPDRTDAVLELDRLTRARRHAESQLAESMERAASAEARAAEWQGRATEAEHNLEDANVLLGTKRVRAGLALGRAADRLRARA